MTSASPFPPAAGARILSLGGYQPGNVVTNDDIAAQVDTNDEWIRSRVGIVSRRFAGPEESVTDMAFVASGKALAGSGLSPGDIDLVIVATCSAEASIPNISAVVAHRLGIVAPGAYDLNAACAGFCYALANASDAIRAGTARHVLVIGSEKMTSWVDPTDRSTCIIFADGAGAAVVGPAEDGEAPGIGPVAWGSAGDLADKITIADRDSFLHQEGQAVFRWATTTMHPVAAQARFRADIAVGQLKEYIPVGIDAELTNKPDWTSSNEKLVEEYEMKETGWEKGERRKRGEVSRAVGKLKKKKTNKKQKTKS
jgi:3-oxoacyl-[acyl-carrier-protein] synthase-3